MTDSSQESYTLRGAADPDAWIPADELLLQILDGREASLNYYRRLCGRACAAFHQYEYLRLTNLMVMAGGSQLRLARLMDYWLSQGLIQPRNDDPGTCDTAERALSLLAASGYGSALQVIGGGPRVELERAVTAARALYPNVREEYDQYRVTVGSAVRRVLYALARLDLSGASVAVLGDDDMHGPALAILGVAARVTTLDIDADLLAAEAKFAADRSVALECVPYDATTNPPAALRGKFDVVLTDPSPQPGETELFVKRAAELLVPRGVLYISLWPTHSPAGLGDQVALTRHGFRITDSVPGLSFYGQDRAVRTAADRDLLDRIAPGMEPAFAETWVRAELDPPQPAGIAHG